MSSELVTEATRYIATHRQQSYIVAGVVGAAAIGTGLWLLLRHKPTEEEIERGRRDRLMEMGRLIDGTVVEGDELPLNNVMYSYRVAGVDYTCAQNLSALGEEASHFRTDLPVQVRYDARNPYNSIVAAENWSGLRR